MNANYLKDVNCSTLLSEFGGKDSILSKGKPSLRAAARVHARNHYSAVSRYYKGNFHWRPWHIKLLFSPSFDSPLLSFPFLSSAEFISTAEGTDAVIGKIESAPTLERAQLFKELRDARLKAVDHLLLKRLGGPNFLDQSWLSEDELRVMSVWCSEATSSGFSYTVRIRAIVIKIGRASCRERV